MAQNQPKEFDIHDPVAVLNKFGQLRQALRQLDDDITGLIYVTVNQMQREQKEEMAKAMAEAKKKKEEAELANSQK